MARLLENGLYQTYFSGSGFYKMGCLIFSIIAIYFNFYGYRLFKQLALEIYEYEQKNVVALDEWSNSILILYVYYQIESVRRQIFHEIFALWCYCINIS